MRMQNRVLIISHNVLSMSSSMGKTLANFLKGIPSENIAQLYFHTEVPTTKISTRYFRITDFDMIKKSKKEMGTVLGEADILEDLKNERVDVGTKAQIYQYGRKRKPYMYVGRNLLWATKKWKNEKLLKWIDDFNPDVIFFASGDYVFPYKIAMEIAKIRNIPIITYICDDYYFLRRKSVSPLYYINRVWYKKTLKKLFLQHKKVVSICDKISVDYAKELGVEANTIMTSSTLSAFVDKEEGENIKISFLGNMGYDRHIALREIGQALKEVSDGKAFLDIYSTETRPEIIKDLTRENGINFCGGISYDEVIKVMKNSDILVHCESMDGLNREKVKYSVSTKIADTLSCGRCLLAYGPEDVASIEYLIDNDCACVVTKKEDLKKALKLLISDFSKRENYSKKALEIGDENHNIDKNCKKFQEILKEAVR